MNFTLRKAKPEDIPAIEQLIADSSRGLSNEDYSKEQIEGALQGAWGVDTELINDSTYFVAEIDSVIVACGGWGRRQTLFGGDKQAGRQSELLDPAKDSARIRAFFVHPDWARKGIAKMILQKCEEEARAFGFRSIELIATLPGYRFYQKFGYTGNKRVEYRLDNDVCIEFIPMKKLLYG